MIQRHAFINLVDRRVDRAQFHHLDAERRDEAPVRGAASGALFRLDTAQFAAHRHHGLAQAATGRSEERLAEAVSRGVTALHAAREQRVRPGRDEKVLAGWNGLMLRAVSLAARAFQEPRHRRMAVRNGELLLRDFLRDGRVLRVAGATPIGGFLEDHAAVALGFLELYQLTFEDRWRAAAAQISDAIVAWFWAELDHDSDRRRCANWVLETLAEPMAEHGLAFGHLLGAADLAVHGAVEVALMGDPESTEHAALAAEVSRHYLPNLAMAGGIPGSDAPVALLADRPMQGGMATAYVCRDYHCDAPTTSVAELASQLTQTNATEVQDA